MHIFFVENIDGDTSMLTGDEAGHCSRVLRGAMGDVIHVTDGKGHLYAAEIKEIRKKEVDLDHLLLVESQEESSQLTIAIAPTKNMARFEWFLEKATEIGVQKIVPILTKRSERKVIKPQRCEKILLAAMKQSKNLHLPELAPLTKFETFVSSEGLPDQKFIAHCMKPERHLSTLYNRDHKGIVLIGPEGDFTSGELELCQANGWVEVSLGTSRLRTETAGIVAAHTVSLLGLKC